MKMTDKQETQNPQVAAMSAGIEASRRIGEEAAARHQQDLEQAAQHSQNVAKLMTDPRAAGMSQGQINTLVKATPAALAKALREIAGHGRSA